VSKKAGQLSLSLSLFPPPGTEGPSDAEKDAIRLQAVPVPGARMEWMFCLLFFEKESLTSLRSAASDPDSSVTSLTQFDFPVDIITCRP